MTCDTLCNINVTLKKKHFGKSVTYDNLYYMSVNKMLFTFPSFSFDNFFSIYHGRFVGDLFFELAFLMTFEKSLHAIAVKDIFFKVPSNIKNVINK